MKPLITDRTYAHVVMLKDLQKKSWDNMTASEQEAWYGEAAKGAYNYTDLNRVEEMVASLATALRLLLKTKTDWTIWNVPVQAEMERYLDNVETLRDTYVGEADFPNLPSSMNRLSYEGANNIEKTLDVVYQLVESDIQSGEIYCSEV